MDMGDRIDPMETMVPNRGFVDFHTHILPAIDDGSPDTETSIRMVESLQKQGVRTFVFTPHFYTDRESLTDFLKRRDTAYEKLLPSVRQAASVQQMDLHVIPACEMYFTDYIYNCSDISPLCVGSGRTLLTEFPYSCDFSESIMGKIARLMSSFDVVPVLAHIERYPKLMKKQDSLSRLIGMGCFAQVNLQSLVGEGLWQRKVLLSYIRNGLVHVVGTDCHNMTARPPLYWDGIEIIRKKAGEQYVDLLTRNAESMINGRGPA